MPRTPPVLTRIDPEFAPLWRDGDTLQFGVHGAVQVRVDQPWVERLVSRLNGGIPLRAFDLIAHTLGAPREDARALLDILRPVLRTDAPPAPAAWVESVNVADSRVAVWMQDLLIDLGVREGARHDPAAVGIVLVHGAAAAVQLHPYLRADVAHLPVAFDAAGTTIGPLVIPGRTPCLTCRDGHDLDRDSAWPLLHCQLVGRDDSPITRPTVAEAAGLVHGILRSPSTAEGSPIVRLSADGTRTRSSVRFHAECRCREQSFRSPRESGTARVRIDLLPETRTA